MGDARTRVRFRLVGARVEAVAVAVVDAFGWHHYYFLLGTAPRRAAGDGGGGCAVQKEEQE